MLDRALDIVAAGSPIEDLPAALPIEEDDPAALADLIALMEQYLIEIFATHDPGCSSLEASSLIGSISPIVCTGCLPPADLRQAIRFVRKQTSFQRNQFRSDPVHWARVIAMAAAPVLRHTEDPYSVLDELDDALVHDPR